MTKISNTGNGFDIWNLINQPTVNNREKQNPNNYKTDTADEINAQFGFERAFGKTNDNADADTKITKFGISFNSDGTTTFFAQLEKSSASQKEYLERLQEKKAEEKKETKKKEQTKQIEVRKTTVQANSKEELLDKIKNIDWDSIKPGENKIGGRFDFQFSVFREG